MPEPSFVQSQSSRHCAIRTVSTNMMALHKQEEENRNRNRNEIREMMEEVRRSMPFVSSKEKKACTDEREEDSAGSSEEMESPRSVGRWRRRTTKEGCVMHSQVLRIREEDSHLGESTVPIGAAAAAAGKDYHGMDVVLFSRPILPSSPLKKTINA
ncbi:hypothetical protein ACFX2I_023516 [Malus domestica]|uniref:uncharacterized protein LOC126610354 n=1 Tax=Malus sylvestris TaxID=3752 RepID=UPI0010A9DF14|nr:uncharacterized protein LOC103404432 [Malus domestica]XP_050134359.1 uncharacterized protein LOC126610354 [Malus sylvestris]